MSFIIAGIALAVLIGLLARSMNREKQAQGQVEAARQRLVAAYGLSDVHVSVDDGSFVGLTADGATVVMGDPGDGDDLVCPVAAIRAVEGLRDDVVLVQTSREGDGLTAPPPSGNPADAPERIHALSLRLTTDDGARTVLFFQSGKHGVEPVNATFRKQAAATEAWFRKLSDAMRAR